MQIGGVIWWQLIGMFGFGAGLGFLIGLSATKKLGRPVPGDWWGQLFGVIFVLILTAFSIPLAGFAAVALAFAAHHAGWDQPLPYLAGIGILFLLFLLGLIFRTFFKK